MICGTRLTFPALLPAVLLLKVSGLKPVLFFQQAQQMLPTVFDPLRHGKLLLQYICPQVHGSQPSAGDISLP